ncbi:MAG: cyclic nucleotide-binding domain-containing protein [Thermotogota bacterium]
MENRDFSAGELIFIQGETDRKIYKLIEGKVVTYLAFQSLTLLDIIIRPQFIGIAPLTGNKHTFTAEAIVDSTIRIFDYDTDNMLEEHTNLTNQLVGKINAIIKQEDFHGRGQLLRQMEKLESFTERFFTRFYSYNLVREVLRELIETGQIKKTEKGQYQKNRESFNLEEGW